MADTDAARIGDVKAGFEAVKADTATRAKTTDVDAAFASMNAKMPIRPEMFGEIGAADDSATLNAFLAYLGENGGYGEITYPHTTTAQVALEGNAVPFELGFVGEGKISATFPESQSVLVFRGCADISLWDVQLDGGYTGPGTVGNHGLTLYNCARIRGSLDVRNWYSSALFVHAETASDAYTDVIFNTVTAISDNAVAHNGILFVNMLNSGVRWSNVSGVTGSPGYALQFKNNCTGCFFDGGQVQNSKIGIALGFEDPSTGVTGSRAVNIKIYDCIQALAVGPSTNNDMQFVFDANNRSDSSNAIDLNAGSVGNRISATVRNLTRSGRYAVNFKAGAQDNTVKLLADKTPNWAVFQSDAAGNINNIVYAESASGYTPASKITDSSGNATNKLVDLSVIGANTWGATQVFNEGIEVQKFLRVGPATSATIAAGVITATASHMVIDTEASAATDDLVTVNGAQQGRVLILRSANNARAITLKDGVGNLQLNGDFTLTSVQSTIVLLGYSSGTWIELSRSTNT